MTPDPKTIEAGIIAAEALSIMNENKIQGLFICEQGHAVGFLHLHDLLRLGTAQPVDETRDTGHRFCGSAGVLRAKWQCTEPARQYDCHHPARRQ